MDNQLGNTVIVVLGMHRSGTSAVTRGLKALGVELGDNLIGPVPGNNERGFWEDRDINELSERVLAAIGRSWHSIGLISPDELQGEDGALAPLRSEAIGLIRGKFNSVALWGFKDPRTVRLLPFWQSIFEYLGIKDRYVITLRNPLSVAQSLALRDGFAKEKSLMLWLQHMVPAINATEGKLRLVIDYDRMLTSPIAEMERIAAKLEINIHEPVRMQLREFADDFLSEGLRHAHYRMEDLKADPAVPELCIIAYSWLEKLACDEVSIEALDFRDAWNFIARSQIKQAPFYRYIDRLLDTADAYSRDLENTRTSVREHESVISNLDARVSAGLSEIAKLQQMLANLELEVVRLNQFVHDKDRQLHLTETSLQEIQEEHRKLQQSLVEQSRQIAWSNAQLESAQAALSESQKAGAAAEVQIQQLRNSCSVLEEQQGISRIELARERAAKLQYEEYLGMVLGSQSWKLTAPLRTIYDWLARSQPRHWITSLWSRTLRNIFYRLPLSFEDRQRIFGFVFTRFGHLLQWTKAYQHWLAETTGSGSIASYTTANQAQQGSNALLPWFYAEDSEHYVPINNRGAVNTSIKLIAFYLPQFHSIPENDRWWGKGFTEWTSVTRAKPQFVGHYQPRLPGELGFYDLRVPEVQERQVELAKMHGIYGFCFYYYWFGGKRLLEKPLNQFVDNERIDFPFCICWANENWTRRWDGMDQEVLMGQAHSPEDDLAFIGNVAPLMRNQHYIRFQGKPLLVVYRVNILPDAAATAQRWRDHCRKNGIGDIYLVAAQTFGTFDPRPYDFDAAVEFPPHFAPHKWNQARIDGGVQVLNPDYHGMLFSYEKVVHFKLAEGSPPYPLFKTVMPSWDNEPRKPGRGNTYVFSNPGTYSRWLQHACQHAVAAHPPGDRLVFVNAWNEWAEGAYLEPDRRYGYAYLQSTADALGKFPAQRAKNQIVCVSHDAYPCGAQFIILNIIRMLKEHFGYETHLILTGEGPLKSEFARFAEIYDVPSDFRTREAQTSLIARLYLDGVRVAICNTSVTGGIAEQLKQQGFTVISLIHELPGLIRTYGLEKSIAKLAASADKIVFPAALVRDRFRSLQEFDLQKGVICPQGVYLRNSCQDNVAQVREQVRAEFQLPRSAQIVLGVGYADHRKGLDLFFKVAAAVTERMRDVYFIWVGNSDERIIGELSKGLTDAHGPKKLIMAGYRKEVGKYYAASEIYLLTSREDPFPSVVLEAMNAGLPVVGFEQAGGFTELLANGCGVLVPHLDAPAMAEAVAQLLSNPEKRIKMGQKAREKAESRPSFLDYVYTLLDLAGEKRHKVSVIVPNYNYAGFLQQRLESIVQQTYRPYEIIFLDDCSSDDSVEVARRLLADSAVPHRILLNDQNRGCYRQWLKGLLEARGDLVWIAEADDYCDKTFLEEVVRAFADEDVVLSYCQSKMIDEHDNLLAENYRAYTDDISADKWLHPYTRAGREEIADTLIIKNTIPNASAVVMRKPDLSPIENHLVQLKNTGDWFAYLHILSTGKISFFPESLNYHRRHGKGITLSNSAIELMREILTVQDFAIEKFGVTGPVQKSIRRSNQAAYEYLGLHLAGPKLFDLNHQLRDVSIERIHAARRS